MTTLWHDIRYGFRMLGRNPGLPAVMMVILAVGIGLIEGAMARLRLTRVPQLLMGASALAALAMILIMK